MAGPSDLVSLQVDDVRVPLVETLAEHLQLQAEDAELTIDHLIRSEQLGKHDHGLIRADYLIRSQKFGPFGHLPAARAQQLSEGRIHLDATGSLGYPALHRFIELGCAQAAKTGCCIGTSRSVYPSGALLDWAHLAIQHNTGLVMVATSPPRVTSPGHSQPVVGTNPICIGLPTHPVPFVSDSSTSAVNHGELLLARATGSRLPPQSAIGPDGQPTDDPQAVDPTRGLGALLPVGGSHKTFALSLGIELLVSLGGMRPGEPTTSEHGVFCLFIGPQLAQAAQTAPTSWLASLNESGMRIPGWQSWKRAQQQREQGIVQVREGTLGVLRNWMPVG